MNLIFYNYLIIVITTTSKNQININQQNCTKITSKECYEDYETKRRNQNFNFKSFVRHNIINDNKFTYYLDCEKFSQEICYIISNTDSHFLYVHNIDSKEEEIDGTNYCEFIFELNQSIEYNDNQLQMLIPSTVYDKKTSIKQLRFIIETEYLVLKECNLLYQSPFDQTISNALVIVEFNNDNESVSINDYNLILTPDYYFSISKPTGKFIIPFEDCKHVKDALSKDSTIHFSKQIITTSSKSKDSYKSYIISKSKFEIIIILVKLLMWIICLFIIGYLIIIIRRFKTIKSYNICMHQTITII